MIQIEKSVSDCASAMGFVLTGFAALKRLVHREEFFHRWIADGRLAEMEWLGRDPERRFDPRSLDRRLRGVVSLAYPYPPPRTPSVDWRSELRGRNDANALGTDYHERVREKSRVVAGRMMTEVPRHLARV